MKPEEHTQDEAEVRDLLRAAGPRPAVPEDDLALIKEAARAEWRRQYAERQDRRPAAPARAASGPARLWRPLALAAGVLVAVGVAVTAFLWGLGRAPLASVQLAAGEVLVASSAAGPWHPLAVGEELAAGAHLRTGAEGGHAALRLGTGVSVRFAAGTHGKLERRSMLAPRTAALRLEDGAVYVDSDPEADPGSPVAIRTAVGEVSHIGSQFEVRQECAAAGGTVRVRAREGTTLVRRQGQDELRAIPGEEITLSTGGEVRLGSVPLFGAEWLWVLESAPPLEMVDLPLGDYLRWVSRETGWHADPAPGIDLAQTVTANLGGLRPDETLAPVLLSCGLRAEVDAEAGRLRVVRIPSESPPTP